MLLDVFHPRPPLALWRLFLIGMTLSLTLLGKLYGQTEQDDILEVENVIQDFFAAMQQLDSSRLAAYLGDQLVLQTVAKTPEGIHIQTTPSSDWLSSLGKLKGHSLEERVSNLVIQRDESLAHAWMDYQFFFDGNLHHCGVNSFVLVEKEEGWKVVHLIDTRRKCESN